MSLLTFVGLEHTGHHLWDAVFRQVLPRAQLTELYFYLTFVIERRPVDVRSLAEYFDLDRQTAVKQGRGRLPLMFNSCSFPCQDVAVVDELKIAQAAKMAGLQLLPLVMTREMPEIVYHFSKRRLRTLNQSCVAMATQLKVLARDHELLHVPYHMAPSLGLAVSKFVGVNITRVLLKTYHTTRRSHNALAKLQASKLDDATEWRALSRCGGRVVEILSSSGGGRQAVRPKGALHKGTLTTGGGLGLTYQNDGATSAS